MCVFLIFSIKIRDIQRFSRCRSRWNAWLLTRNIPPCSLLLLSGIPLWSCLLWKPSDITWPPCHLLRPWIITSLRPLAPSQVISASDLIFLSTTLARISFVTLYSKIDIKLLQSFETCVGRANKAYLIFKILTLGHKSNFFFNIKKIFLKILNQTKT